MKSIDFVSDYHRVLRMIKNYNVEEVEKLIESIRAYADLMRSCDEGEAPDIESIDINQPQRA